MTDAREQRKITIKRRVDVESDLKPLQTTYRKEILPKFMLEWMDGQSLETLRDAAVNFEKTYMLTGLHLLIWYTCDIDSYEDDGITEAILKTMIRRMLSAGFSLDDVIDCPPIRRSCIGFTPLLLAVAKQRNIFAKVLISMGANVNGCDKNGYSPVHWLIFSRNRCYDLLPELVNNGANIQYSDRHVPPSLHTAVDEGNLLLVCELLKHGADINTCHLYHVLADSEWVRGSFRYACGDGQLVAKKISTIGRAIRMRKKEIFNVLLQDPRIVLTADDINFLFLENDTELALAALKVFGYEKMVTSILNDDWLLFNLGKEAFEGDMFTYTVQVIAEFLRHGFDYKQKSLKMGNYKRKIDNDWKGTTLLERLKEVPSSSWGKICRNGQPPLEIFLSCKCGNTMLSCDKKLSLMSELLDSGLDVSNLSLDYFLYGRCKCLFKNSTLLKKLWWAGAKIPDLKHFFVFTTMTLKGKEACSSNLLDHLVEEIGKMDISLQRQCGIVIRKSLRKPDLENLKNFQCALGQGSWLIRLLKAEYL